MFVGSDDGDGGDGCESISTRFEACDVDVGDALDLVGGPHRFDTSTGVLTRADGSTPILGERLTADNVHLVSVQSFSIAADSSLRVTGDVPLVIAAQQTAILDGDIDVSSGNILGAGADAPECAAITAMDGMSFEATVGGTGGGGGGGGGFGGVGGSGGAGDTDQTVLILGGAGGGATDELPNIRGGCSGGSGGSDGFNGTTGPPGGSGGGALYVVAGDQIDVTGVLGAGGEGGASGLQSTGGAGGGSGGLIGLEAPIVAVGADAVIAANGGGGSAGAFSGNDAGAGADATADDLAAAGGRGDSSNGDGGDGAAGTAVDGQPGVPESSSGGGGGGAAGWILIFSTDRRIDPGAIISPPASP